ncbi:MAG: D-alanyl-D-alanine carboxypeptidase family protein [Pseudomonadota bacterium]
MTQYATRLITLLVGLSLMAASTWANRMPTPAPPALNASSYLVIDANSGAAVAAMNPDMQVEPASLTKLMTAYVVFKALEGGQIALTDEVIISERAHAAGQGGSSTMYARLGSRVTVENLLQGMIVVSGNDASVALAEHVAGTESVFADLMNGFAGELGMLSTSFRNAHGLPAENQFSTARDMTKLARAIIREFPDQYYRYSQQSYTWDGVTQSNRNKLLGSDGVDGMKTGRTDAAGWCLVTSSQRGNMRLISAVMGTESDRARTDASRALLNYGFRFFETRQLYAAGAAIDNAKVWKGDADAVPLGLARDLFVTVPRGAWDELAPTLTVRRTLYAPLEQGVEVGRVSIALDGEELTSAPVQLLGSVERGGLWKRMTDEVRLWFN